MKSASLCSLAGRYDKPILPRYLAPIDSLKIPALYCAGIFKKTNLWGPSRNLSYLPASQCSLAGRYDNPISTRILAPIDYYKIPEHVILNF
jgi:hypothetical protein